MDAVLRSRLFDRRLFAATAVCFAAIVFVGFAPTYYLRSLFPAPALLSITHLHGALMTAWVILFATQVWFISSKRVRLHQRLGYAGVVLGIVLIIVGVATALYAAKYSPTFAPPGMLPAQFMIVPFFDLIMFALFFGAAVVYRRQPAIHKRLMLLTAINFLPPAVARISIPALTSLGPLWFFGFPTALALLCVAVDAWHTGKVNRILLAGTAALIVSYIVRLTVMGTETWMTIAQQLVSYV